MDEGVFWTAILPSVWAGFDGLSESAVDFGFCRYGHGHFFELSENVDGS